MRYLVASSDQVFISFLMLEMGISQSLSSVMEESWIVIRVPTVIKSGRACHPN